MDKFCASVCLEGGLPVRFAQRQGKGAHKNFLAEKSV